MAQNVNEKLLADAKDVEEYNRKHKTRLTYGQYKSMIYLESIKKKARKKVKQ